MTTTAIRYEVKRGHNWEMTGPEEVRWEVAEEAESSKEPSGTVEAGGQTYRWTRYRHVGVELTPEEMAELDDGQGWYQPGDECHLGGWVTAARTGSAQNLDLCVNGTTNDNWTTLAELPAGIRDRLERSED